MSVQGERLLDSMLRQLVYFRFGAALESRARFLDYWVNQRRFKGKDMFSVSLFVNLALQQQELLTDQSNTQGRGICGIQRSGLYGYVHGPRKA